MRLMGAAAPCAQPLTEEVSEALYAGRAVFLWSDGEDVVALVGDEADEAQVVAKMARRAVVEFA